MAAGLTYTPIQILDANGDATAGESLAFLSSASQPQPFSNPVTSGALSTTTVSSGTGKQNPAAYQVTVYGVWTSDATNNVATLTVALSPDNTTYSNVQVYSLAAAVNNTGAVALPITLVLPAGWYMKFTSVHGTVGTLTYA